jgi:hypothetical protein
MFAGFLVGTILEAVSMQDELVDQMSGGCAVGCIYSTKFYYKYMNDTEFKTDTWDCLSYCIL